MYDKLKFEFLLFFQNLRFFPKTNRCIAFVRGKNRATERKVDSSRKRLLSGKTKKERTNMSNNNNNRINIPEAREGMNQFKMQAANEVGVDLKQGYNGHLTSREAGSIGGQMVKKMVEAYEQGLK